jgi:hypothetical protein
VVVLIGNMYKLNKYEIHLFDTVDNRRSMTSKNNVRKPASKDKSKITLSNYYKTTWWGKFRKSITDDDDCCCEICKRRRWSFYKIGKNKGKRKPKPDLRISIHHKHYHSMFKEKRSDVIALCTLCHDTMHNLHTLSNMTKEYKSAYDYLTNNTVWEHEKRRKP